MVRLRMPANGSGVEEKLFRANALLSSGTPSSLSLALKLYTEVLYKDCPGHICAFLNRSLTYIGLGYPELAVADAHRAAQVCTETKRVHKITRYRISRGKEGGQRYEMCWDFQQPNAGSAEVPIADIVKAVQAYLAAEKLQIRAGEPWTSNPSCFLRRPFTEWLQTDLASIPLSDIGLADYTRPVFEGLEFRAIYRLVGALWLCGCGAISDAIGLSSDMLSLNKDADHWLLTYDEIESFECIGDAMVNETYWYIKYGKWTLDGMMKTKTAYVNRVIYPWNSYHPNMSEYKTREALEFLCDNVARVCTVRHNEATEETPFTLYLIAAVDIKPEDEILFEFSMLQATTPCKKYFVCDVCAARLITPENIEDGTGHGHSTSVNSSKVSGSNHAKKDENDKNKQHTDLSDKIDDYARKKDKNSNPTHVNEQESLQLDSDDDNDDDDGDDDRNGSYDYDGDDILLRAVLSTLPVKARVPGQQTTNEFISTKDIPQRTLSPGTLQSSKLEHSENGHVDADTDACFSPPKKVKKHMDLLSCHRCKEVAYCSQDCAEAGKESHEIVCRVGAENIIAQREWVANRQLEGLESFVRKKLPKSKATYLHHQMLLKVIGMSETRDEHPLELQDTKWLNGGLFAAPKLAAFASEICMDDDAYGDPAPTAQTKKLPWSYEANVVIPIRLLAELRIDPWNDLDKYDGWILNTLFAKFEHCMQMSQGFKYVNLYDDEGNIAVRGSLDHHRRGKGVSIGSIYPFFSMVQVADPAQHQVANSKYREEDSLVGRALCPSESRCPDSPGEQQYQDTQKHKELQDVAIRAGQPILRYSSTRVEAVPPHISNVGSTRSSAGRSEPKHMQCETIMEDSEDQTELH